MLAMEQILYELNGEELNDQGLPPGFRFHPTDEELITFYLASKVFKGTFCGVDIAEVDLNRCEPWELPDVAKMGEREWYFYSLRDRKYPTGLRTNRATGAGYWKATGKDREVYSASNGCLLGMKKTLVFYKGRAPRGEKTKWVMHEYRLDGDFSYRHHASKEEWVICRIFHKNGEKKNPIFQCQSYLLESALSSSTTSNSLPPLLETNHPTTTTTPLVDQCQSEAAMKLQAFQNPFHIPENDLKRFMSSVVSQSNLLSSSEQPITHKSPISINPIVNNNMMLYAPSPSIDLFKSLLSHQDSTVLLLKQQQQQQQQQQFNKAAAADSSFTTHNLEATEGDDANSNILMDGIKKKMMHPEHDAHAHAPSYHQHPLFFETECNSSPHLPDHHVSLHDISTSISFNRPNYHTILDPHVNILHDAHGESWPLDA